MVIVFDLVDLLGLFGLFGLFDLFESFVMVSKFLKMRLNAAKMDDLEDYRAPFERWLCLLIGISQWLNEACSGCCPGKEHGCWSLVRCPSKLRMCKGSLVDYS